ncbi:hypothetical protein AV530_009851 [Patagioenas fasciata monilis]|uniref:Uncharacterized protein n=1 Tax=Patagioenas fasciata monilis TaxID=372326 RepID=A0A1V4KAE8_PATFA|nr:hypothetical protein AV530_009851 [Patagioenas fasciata monilis]
MRGDLNAVLVLIGKVEKKQRHGAHLMYEGQRAGYGVGRTYLKLLPVASQPNSKCLKTRQDSFWHHLRLQL